MKKHLNKNCVSIKKFNDSNVWISVRIEDLKEGVGKVVIYVGEDPIIIIPSTAFPSFEGVIEEIIEKTPLYNEKNEKSVIEILFNGLYLGIRDWSENNYDNQLLHFKISFPLLKKLREVGETKFQIIFQQEILKGYATSTIKVKQFLEQEGYLKLIGHFF